jgi:hypothetical protein
MPKIINLTHEKLNRSWERLNETMARTERVHAALEDELRRALLICAGSKRARERRQSKNAHPLAFFLTATVVLSLQLLSALAT